MRDSNIRGVISYIHKVQVTFEIALTQPHNATIQRKNLQSAAAQTRGIRDVRQIGGTGETGTGKPGGTLDYKSPNP